MDIIFSQKKLNQQKKVTKIKYCGILILVSGLFFLIKHFATPSANLHELKVATVNKRDLRITISAPAVIKAHKEEVIESETRAKVKRVWAYAGEFVKKGQMLLELDMRNIEFELAKANEGIAIKKNQIKQKTLELKQSKYHAKDELEKLNIELESAEALFERKQHLHERGGLSRFELQEAEILVKKKKIDIRQTSQKQQNSERLVNALIDNLHLELAVLELNAKEKQRLLSLSKISAPQDGLLIWIEQEEGRMVENGDTLLRLADTSHFEVEATTSSYYENKLFQDMPAFFEIDNVEFNGTIRSILSVPDEGKINLTISLNKSDKIKKLRHLQRVNVNFLLATEDNALSLEKGSLFDNLEDQSVYVIEGGYANKRQIRYANGNENYIRILQGLSVGDQVIVSSTESFRHINRIKINRY